MKSIKKIASTAKKSAKIVSMVAAATAMCETVDMGLDKMAMMTAMRDMGVPAEDRPAVIVDMWDGFGDFIA